MSLLKEIFQAEHERLMDELIESGVPESRAYDLAATAAYSALPDLCADHFGAADRARKMAKGE